MFLVDLHNGKLLPISKLSSVYKIGNKRMLQRSRSKWTTKSDSKIYPHKRAKVCQYFVFTVQKAKEIESSRVKDGDLWKIYSLIWL